MRISITKGEELYKLFEGNRYAACLDRESSVLYGFDRRTDCAVKIAENVSSDEMSALYSEWVESEKPKPEEIQLIEGLVKIVALTRPETPVLKRALKYLEENGRK